MGCRRASERHVGCRGKRRSHAARGRIHRPALACSGGHRAPTAYGPAPPSRAEPSRRRPVLCPSRGTGRGGNTAPPDA
jgi:hypothetical protein